MIGDDNAGTPHLDRAPDQHGRGSHRQQRAQRVAHPHAPCAGWAPTQNSKQITAAGRIGDRADVGRFRATTEDRVPCQNPSHVL
jgi:hypothetical protein